MKRRSPQNQQFVKKKKMEQVLFGDNFVNILLHLRSKDVYVLSQVCGAYRKQITKDAIMNSIGCDVMRKLRNSLREKYDDFIKMCIELNASIAGQFITQCMCDEDWGTKIIVLVPKPKSIKSCMRYYDDRSYVYTNFPINRYDEEIVKCVTDKFVRTQDVRSVPISNRYEMLDSFNCRSGGVHISIQFLCFLAVPISTKKYILANHMYDTVFKNAYNVKTGSVYVHNMTNIFEKRTKLSGTFDQSLVIHDMGFNFCDSNSKILSKIDIVAKYYDVMKVRRHELSKIDLEKMFGKVMLLKNNMIYYEQGGLKFHVYLLFNVIETIPICKKKQRLKIDNCPYGACCVKKLYPNMVHMHGEHIAHDTRKVGSKGIILFLVQ